MTGEYEKHDVRLVNHTKGPCKRASKFLQESGRVAVHFDDVPSFDYTHEAYADNGRNDLKSLKNAHEDDYIIVGNYASNIENLILMGESSRREILVWDDDRGEAEEVIPLEDAEESSISEEYSEDRYRFLKSVRLENERRIWRWENNEVFWTKNLPKQGTVRNVNKLSDQVRRRMGEDKLPCEASSFDDTSLEILCEEYIRLKNPSYRRLLAAECVDGKGERDNLQQIDFAGTTDGKDIIAQVTNPGNSSRVELKVEEISKYPEDKFELWFFGPEGMGGKSRDWVDKYVSFDTVIKELREDPESKRLLKRKLS
jgi:hypothetical protein